MRKSLIRFMYVTMFLLVILCVNFSKEILTVVPVEPKKQEERKMQRIYALDEQYDIDAGEFDEGFTDSDKFHLDKSINGKYEYNIRDYKEELLSVNSKYVKNSTTHTATDDDPIINIVPKELFNCRGTYLYVGKEYGKALRFRPNVKSH